MSDTPKIIVDSDWKSQAQAEKERLTAAEKAKPAAPPAGGTADDPYALPAADFDELVRMFASQVLLYLGAFPDPESGRRLVSLEAAKFNIDMLALVETKTKGNLTPDETQTLTKVLYELRMQFVEVSKAVQKAIDEGKLKPSEAPRAPGRP
ncbi:MAG: DUF1844 domain-containing protein [Phycisphaerales bacterium]